MRKIPISETLPDPSELPASLKCVGRVVPEVSKLDIQQPTPVVYSDAISTGMFEFSICNSQISIEIALPNSESLTIEWAVIKAYELVTTAVDIEAYLRGWALQVVIDATIENGQKRPLILSHLCSQRGVGKY